MSELNLLLLEGFIYCPKCLAQIPESFLACPNCYGLLRERGHWVAPAPAPEPARADGEQPLLFDASAAEYPA